MKKIVLTLLLCTATVAYSQKLKGNLKLGGIQSGEPFFITYKNIATGKLIPSSGWLSMQIPSNQTSTAYFNYGNENKLKVVFQNGESKYLFDIWNISIEEDEDLGAITTAIASHPDVEGGKARIKLTKDMLRIIIVETDFVIEFTRPQKK